MYDSPRPEEELAAQLLDVTNEGELERFLGRLVESVARRAGGRVPVATRRALMAVLRRVAKRTLPTVVTAIGDPLGPAAGIDRSVAEAAARVYGLELEGMSAEDRDYEIARQFLRFARAVVARAARSPAAGVDTAVASASRELAPGLLPPQPAMSIGARSPRP
jgi:hypothetical protein